MSVATHTMVGVRNDAFPHTEQENALIVALLHDTIEDTAVTYEEITEAFGEEIAKGVVALTKNTTLGDKSAQMEDSLQRIHAQPHWVWCVKLADRITNLTGVPSHWSVTKKLLIGMKPKKFGRRCTLHHLIFLPNYTKNSAV